MSRRLKYVDYQGGTTIWTNPDVPTIDEILGEDGFVDFGCPDPDCDGTFNIRLDGDPDLRAMCRDLESQNGTMRCSHCDEPLYGIDGDGDHDDDFHGGAWKEQTHCP